MGQRGGIQGLGPTHPSVIGAIVVFITFGVVWVFFVLPYLEAQSWYLALPPIQAYPIYIIGELFLVFGIFGFLIGVFSHRGRFNPLKGFLFGLIGFSGLEAIDLFFPPFYLSQSGQVLIPLGGNQLENTATDALSAYLWNSLIPGLVTINIGPFNLLYVFTYFVTFVILVIVLIFFIALDVGPHTFLRLLGIKKTGR